MSGVGTAIGIGAAVGAVGSIGGAAISSNAAGNAAAQQSAAANHAADLQYQASQNALGFQQGQFNTEQQELAPWLQSGSAGLSNLDYLLGVGQPSSLSGTPSGTAQTGQASPLQASPNGTMGMTPVASGTPGNLLPSTTNQAVSNAQGVGVPGSSAPTPSGVDPAPNLSSTPNTSLGAEGSLLAPYPGGQFTAPTAEQAAQTPGYQFQQQQGQQAVQQSAAARGNLLTGGTAEALDNYSQGLAASNYQNTYNNAYNTYASNYNQYNQQQTNQYNKLAALAGMGQQTASTLGTLGQNAANSMANTTTNAANAIGQNINNAGAANASGIVGSANAWSGALGNTGNNLSQLTMLQSLMGGQANASSGAAGGYDVNTVPVAGLNMYGG